MNIASPTIKNLRDLKARQDKTGKAQITVKGFEYGIFRDEAFQWVLLPWIDPEMNHTHYKGLDYDEAISLID